MKQLEADIVVVASGPGGLAAAVTAAQGGAKVTLLEVRIKADKPTTYYWEYSTDRIYEGVGGLLYRSLD